MLDVKLINPPTIGIYNFLNSSMERAGLLQQVIIAEYYKKD